MFTATGIERPASVHVRTWLSARRSTSVVSAWMTAVFSACGMNPSGCTSPRVGCCHRTRASTLCITPVLVPTLGWLMTGGYIAVVFFLATEGWAKALPPDARNGGLRALYRDELARQNRVRRAMWWIWFVPLFAGLITNLLMKGVQTSDPLRILLGLGSAALLAACIVGLNRDRSQGVVRKIAILNLAGH